MSSLKQKAKALKQILWDKRLEFDKWLQSGISEYPELTEEFNDLWVRLEDAEQALTELKQKLSPVFEMLSEIGGKRGPYSQNQLAHAENVINNSSENAKKIRLILEGLLKEKEAKP